MNASCAVYKILQGLLKAQRLTCKAMDNVVVVYETASYILMLCLFYGQHKISMSERQHFVSGSENDETEILKGACKTHNRFVNLR